MWKYFIFMVHLIFTEPFKININTSIVPMRKMKCREFEQLALEYTVLELEWEKRI